MIVMNNISSNSTSKKVIKSFVSAYLSKRPLFFACIRPQEAYLFRLNKQYLRGKILDFGCGDGYFAHLVWPRRKLHAGLDLKESRIKQAKKYNVYKELVEYDGDMIPFADQFFHTIVSNCVFEHLPDLDQNLKEMYRVLKPGGYLLTSVMTRRWDEYLYGRKFLGDKYTQFMRRNQVHQNLLTHKQWEAKFKAKGFSIISATGYLDKSTSQWLDIFHYFSLTSLITYKLFKRWQLIPHWFRLFNLDQLIASKLLKSLKVNPNQSAAIFYVLSK